MRAEGGNRDRDYVTIRRRLMGGREREKERERERKRGGEKRNERNQGGSNRLDE